MSIFVVFGDTMPKATVVAVGDTPLNPLNDLLKQNSISSKVVDATTSSVDEIDKLIQADDQCQCVLLKGVSSLGQHIPRIADATEKLVLLYCSPTTALSNSLELSNGSIKPELAINQWQEAVNQAMELAQENDSYSLCDLSDILNNPSTFLAEFFAIEKAAESKLSTYTKKQFANHLATLHLFEQDDAFALYDEALSIGKLFGEFTVHLGPDSDEIKQSAVDSGQSVFNQLITNHQEIQSKCNEIENLKAQSSEKVNALENQIAELQHTKAAFEENSTQLQEELKKSKALADQQSSKIEDLQGTKQNIESKLQAATAQLEKSQNEVTALASALSAKEASLSENHERTTNLQSQLQENEQLNTQLQGQIEELRVSSAKLSEELSQQKQVIAERDKDKEAKTAAFKELEDKLQSVSQQVSELNSEKTELTNTVQQLKERLVNQQSVNEELETECKVTKNSLQETQQQLQAANARVTELEAQQGELNSTIEQLNEQLVNQQSVNEEKEKECIAAKNALQESKQQLQSAKTRVTELEARHGDLKATVEKVNGQLQSQQTVIEENEKTLAFNEKLLKEYQDKLQTANQQNDQLEEKVMDLQVQHKEAIVSKERECAELSNELTQAQASLQETTDKLAKHLDENAGVTQELQLANLQVAQLQEELEATFSELQEARATEVLYEETQPKLTAITQQVEQLIQDKELSELQISQLQEELELITAQKVELEAASILSENVIAEKSWQVDLLTTKNDELAAQSSSLKKQVEAATKKRGLEEQTLVNELQAQLEQQLKQTQLLENNNAKLQEQLSQSEAGMIHNNEFQQAELELASLQISQLQDELEYYYSAWQQAQQNGTQVVKMGKHHQKVFNKAQAESLAVTGKYSEDGYKDVHFMLTNVLLGDGRSFAELPVKLVRIGEYVAIEFRDNSEGLLFQHFEDSVDEYGPFLRFFVQPPESNLDQQQVTFSRMNASDRILLMSVINLLAEHIQESDINCQTVLTSSDWRTWRISAIQLAELIEDMPIWLSFDSVILKEEYQTEGYEHLWLSFHNILVGDSWKELLELKVAATGINSGKDTFCDAISLEFREQEDGTVPLLTWPPETVDEHGPKFTVSLSGLDNLSEVARSDRLLILHLATNLPEIINKITENAELVSRHKDQWADAAQFLLAAPKAVSNSDNYEVDS